MNRTSKDAYIGAEVISLVVGLKMFLERAFVDLLSVAKKKD
jgi:hypothetical protein